MNPVLEPKGYRLCFLAITVFSPERQSAVWRVAVITPTLQAQGQPNPPSTRCLPPPTRAIRAHAARYPPPVNPYLTNPYYRYLPGVLGAYAPGIYGYGGLNSTTGTYGGLNNPNTIGYGAYPGYGQTYNPYTRSYAAYPGYGYGQTYNPYARGYGSYPGYGYGGPFNPYGIGYGTNIYPFGGFGGGGLGGLGGGSPAWYTNGGGLAGSGRVTDTVKKLAPLLPDGSATGTGAISDDVKKLAPLLPDGTQLTDRGVVTGAVGDKQVMTVGEKLTQLRAYSQDGTIYDGSGKEIKFFHWPMPSGVAGPPPGTDNYTIQQRAAEELARLKKQYTVIEVASSMPWYAAPP